MTFLNIDLRSHWKSAFEISHVHIEYKCLTISSPTKCYLICLLPSSRWCFLSNTRCLEVQGMEKGFYFVQAVDGRGLLPKCLPGHYWLESITKPTCATNHQLSYFFSPRKLRSILNVSHVVNKSISAVSLFLQKNELVMKKLNVSCWAHDNLLLNYVAILKWVFLSTF